MKILGIPGSLRSKSFNKAALEAVAELLPAGAQMTLVDLNEIPMYNPDLEAQGEPPEAVRRFKAQIAEADALVIATPEYNGSYPGSLKNALDWASRQGSPLAGKPVAILGAATGMLGTVRAQYQLRQLCVGLNMHAMNRPEVFIGKAHEKFDAEGNLVNEETRQMLELFVNGLLDWTRRLNAGAMAHN